MSVRIKTVGPSPLRSTATTPWPPTCSLTTKPTSRSRAAIFAAVFSS